jgi:transposase
MTALYAGLDLHSNNNVIGLIDGQGKRVFGRRVPNDRQVVQGVLSPYKGDIVGIAVESTYNWYWLVDTWMDEGYKVHLANPSAIQQYHGLKYADDKHDAFWLAEMLRLGILPAPTKAVSYCFGTQEWPFMQRQYIPLNPICGSVQGDPQIGQGVPKGPGT